MNALRLSSIALFFVAFSTCGTPEPTCECGVPSWNGTQIFACGASACIDSVGYQCAGHGHPVSSPFACPAMPPVTSCTRKTCATANTACGPVSDGCGGTLECGACSGSDRCTNGQCVVNPCAQAVCGTVQGTSCGTCAGTSTCSVDQRQCIEKVATLTGTTGVMHGAVAGNSLYLSLAHASDTSVVEVDLTTGTQRNLKTGELRVSPLASNGSHLFYASSTGLHRVAVGSTTVEDLSGLAGTCSSLLADAQHVYCGVGGDPRLGVSYFGIDRGPVGGGVRTDVVSYLNYPAMAKVGNLLFHVGTTDNYASFAVMGVTDLNDMSGQSLVSGGALDSNFVLADSDAFYFLGEGKLTRAPFDNSASRELAATTWLRQETTVADGSAVFAISSIGGHGGLYRLAITGGAEKLVDVADLGGNLDAISALFKSGTSWVVVTNTAVYRVRAP